LNPQEAESVLTKNEKPVERIVWVTLDRQMPVRFEESQDRSKYQRQRLCSVDIDRMLETRGRSFWS